MANREVLFVAVSAQKAMLLSAAQKAAAGCVAQAQGSRLVSTTASAAQRVLPNITATVAPCATLKRDCH